MSHPISISIIIPIFNNGIYLSKCIDSILAQSFNNFEIILINDGSTDNSGILIEEYSSRDSRVIGIHRPNRGVSAARNLGIEKARGEFILFVDGDDYLADGNILKNFYETSKCQNLDILRGEYLSIDEFNNEILIRDYSYKSQYEGKVLSCGEFVNNVSDGELLTVLCLIRKEAIGNIRFKESQKFMEDMRFYGELLTQPLRCGYTNSKFYAYRKYNTPLTPVHQYYKLKDALDVCSFFFNLAENSEDKLYSEFCKNRSITTYYNILLSLISRVHYTNRKKIIKDLGMYPIWKKIRRTTCKSSNKKVLFFTYIAPYLSTTILHYCYIIYNFNKL